MQIDLPHPVTRHQSVPKHPNDKGLDTLIQDHMFSSFSVFSSLPLLPTKHLHPPLLRVVSTSCLSCLDHQATETKPIASLQSPADDVKHLLHDTKLAACRFRPPLCLSRDQRLQQEPEHDPTPPPTPVASSVVSEKDNKAIFRIRTSSIASPCPQQQAATLSESHCHTQSSTHCTRHWPFAWSGSVQHLGPEIGSQTLSKRSEVNLTPLCQSQRSSRLQDP